MIFPPPLSWHALLYAALLSVFCVASAIPALGQTTLIGRIHDEHESPVPGANVLLLRAADSLLVQGAVTTGDGRFAIEAVAAERDVGTISLRPGDILLDGVLVEARRGTAPTPSAPSTSARARCG